MLYIKDQKVMFIYKIDNLKGSILIAIVTVRKSKHFCFELSLTRSNKNEKG